MTGWRSVKDDSVILATFNQTDYRRESNVIVNQLITETLTESDIATLRQSLPGPLAARVEQVSLLTSARNAIQQKYLQVLKSSKEADGLGIIEVPLLPTEITGPARLIEFSLNLIPKGYRSAAEITSGPTPLMDREEKPSLIYEDAVEELFMEGEKVMLINLNKSPHYNGKIGEVVKVSEDGRVVIRVKDPLSNKFKVLSLRSENLESVNGNDNRFL